MTTTKTPAPAERALTMFWVMRCHHTERGVLSVYAERDAGGRPRPHRDKRSAFTAAGFLGGRALGFHVMETKADERGEVLDVRWPRGHNS